MENRTAPVLSLGDWIITFIILANVNARNARAACMMVTGARRVSAGAFLAHQSVS